MTPEPLTELVRGGGGINKGVFLDLEESQKERDTRENIDYKRCHGEGEKKEEKYSYYIH